MAEQQGILTYSGKLGNTVGYVRGDKHFKRMKPSSYMPNEESQKSGAEFGKGSNACALLKMAFPPLLLRAFKTDLHNRLAAVLRKIIRTGPVAKKGNREVFDGNLSLLKGFQFNAKVHFSKLCLAPIETVLTANEINISISPFAWQNCIKAPKAASVVKIGLCCVFTDFVNGEFEAVKGTELSLTKGATFKGGRLKIAIPEGKELGVLLVVNIFFESDFNGSTYLVENLKFQAGEILDSVHVKNGEIVCFVEEELPDKATEKPTVENDNFRTLEWEEY